MNARKVFALIIIMIFCLGTISQPTAFGLAKSGYAEGWNISGTLAGWEANTVKTHVAVVDSGGNPGGYLYTFGDVGDSFDIGAVSKLPEVTGDYRGTKWRISFDLLFISGSFDHAWLRFRYQDAGHNGWRHSLICGSACAPIGKWTHFEVSFDPAWSDSEAMAAGWEQESFSPSWNQTMSNVFSTEIRISSEGFSEAGIDNFMQSGVGACISPPSSLVAWWPGDGNANDLAGGRHGTSMNGATFGPGLVAQAFSFNGSSWVEVPDDPVWTLGARDFTIDLWANFNGLSGRDPLISHDDGGGGQNKWIFWYDARGHDKLLNVPALRFL